MLKAIKVRIYPDDVQKQFISRQLGCCRKIYNLLLDYKKTEWEQNKHSVGLKDMGKYLTELKTKDEYFYLNDVHSKVLQQSMQDLNKAFDNFFKSLKKINRQVILNLNLNMIQNSLVDSHLIYLIELIINVIKLKETELL